MAVKPRDPILRAAEILSNVIIDVNNGINMLCGSGSAYFEEKSEIIEGNDDI